MKSTHNPILGFLIYIYIKLYQKINRDSGESYLSYIVIVILPKKILQYTLYKLLFP